MKNLGDCLLWLDSIEAASAARTAGAWPLSTILDHCAQSIEMSMDGYPQAKGALFQKTAGRAAFAVFGLRGRMSHGLAEPIPGAPSLAAGSDWRQPASRLRAAIARFQSHEGPFAPHFAYGSLTKQQYELAHALHIANHGEEIAAAAAG